MFIVKLFFVNQGYRCYNTSTQQLVNILKGKVSPMNNIIRADGDMLSDTLPDLMNGSMFPNGRFCVDYHPYSVTEDNVQYVSDKYRVHVTPGTSSSERCHAVSFLSQYDGENTRCCNAEIYTDAENSEQHVIQHIIKAIDHFTRQDYKGKVVLEIQFNEKCNQVVDNFVECHGLKHFHGSKKYLIISRI